MRSTRHIGVGSLRAWLALGAGLAAVAACDRVGPPPCPTGSLPVHAADTSYAKPDPSLAKRFFPDGHVRPFEAGWFAGKLIDFRESPLAEHARSRGVTAYRVLYLPSLVLTGDWVVRVEHGAGGARLTSKRSVKCEDRKGDGLALGVQYLRMSEKRWTDLAACMEQAFWSAPYRDSVDGFDGMTVVVEGFRSGRYHIVQRWELGQEGLTPARNKLARCVALIEIAAHFKTVVAPPSLRYAAGNGVNVYAGTAMAAWTAPRLRAKRLWR